MPPVRLALIWHMHQPSYRDALRERVALPWVRLHATKDYRDMAAILRRFPRVHATFNLTPSLLDQLDALAGGATDDYLDLARRPPESWTEAERRFALSRFFSANRDHMIEPHAPYAALWRRVEAAAGCPPAPDVAERIPSDALDAEALRDLVVWFHLAWADPSYGRDEPIRSLLRKGSGFSEEEKNALLDWGVACAGSVVGEYAALARSGQAELTTGALHHPILPLLIDTESPREISSAIVLPRPPFRAPEDAAEQLRRAMESHARRFGAPPRGTWPPEGAVSDAALARIAEAGFTWAASDEAVLAGALRARDGREPDMHSALYRPYHADTASGPVRMVFRDRGLSDRIGFTYSSWAPEAAAEDFLARVRAVAPAAGEDSALVTVILDGENCWEWYPDDGIPFLTSLYERLQAATDVEAVTVSEAMERHPATEALPGVPVGSWIRSDLGIWVGHPDKNRAWEELSAARDAVLESRAPGGPTRDRGAPMEEIYAAEASDWTWWYGEDHPSPDRPTMDRLFRAHLLRAYELAGRAAPESLRRSLRSDAGDGSGTDRAEFPYVRPVLDGRETDFHEWRRARRYAAAGGYGAMHRASSAAREIRYGTDGTNLWVRVDPAETSGAEPKGAVSLGETRIEFDGGGEARVASSGGGGEVRWREAGGASGEDPGEYAGEEILEVRLPLARCTRAEGGPVRFRLAIQGPEGAEESYPEAGWLEIPGARTPVELQDWSAL